MTARRQRSRKTQRPVSDDEFKLLLERAAARGAEPEASTETDFDDDQPQLGKVFSLGLKRGSLKLEQNLGCELPVCVGNRRDARLDAIEFATDSGLTWRLERTAGSLLPAPEHYAYWLWFLDRCQAASESGWSEPPKVLVNPPEIFDLLGFPKGKKGGYHGSRYAVLDDAFRRFAHLVITKRSAFFERGVSYSGHATLGTLCYYSSWRGEYVGARQGEFEFTKGWVSPGPLLWQSIQAGYIKSIPLEPLKQLDYVEQRLLTYLKKHCKPGCEFAISPEKLLPRIPVRWRTEDLKSKLGPHHEVLSKVGFLDDARIEGRGRHKLIVYRRTLSFPSNPRAS